MGSSHAGTYLPNRDRGREGREALRVVEYDKEPEEDLQTAVDAFTSHTNKPGTEKRPQDVWTASITMSGYTPSRLLA